MGAHPAKAMPFILGRNLFGVRRKSSPRRFGSGTESGKALCCSPTPVSASPEVGSCPVFRSHPVEGGLFGPSQGHFPNPKRRVEDSRRTPQKLDAWKTHKVNGITLAGWSDNL
jgi:hypothetical protein